VRGVDAELGEVPRRGRRSEEEGLRCHCHGDLGSWDSWMATGLLGGARGWADWQRGPEGTEAGLLVPFRRSFVCLL
jgi:hypothetical protein